MVKQAFEANRKFKITQIWLVIMMIFIAEFLAYTWCRVQCVKIGYEISKETNKQLKLVSLQNNLKIEFARLKTPERLTQIAQQKLELIMPSPDQIIVIP